MATSRFDYVQYDVQAQAAQAAIKEAFQQLETVVTTNLPPGRPYSLVVTKLEEAYMWVGKGVRDAQLARTPGTPLQEARNTA